MLDVTRNSFDESKGYCSLAFQRNRDVLDSELNELQDTIRVDVYRGRERLERTLSSGVDAGPKVIVGASALGAGKDFSAKSGTATQLVLHAGDCQIYGYRVFSETDITINGLTAPLAPRTDYVWVALQESWIDSAGDPNIAVARLGETSQRRKLLVTFGVTEGAAPVSTGEPWMGLVTYVIIGKLYRTVTNTAFEAFVDLRQLGGSLARGSSNNLFFSAARIALDSTGTSLTMEGLTVSDPFLGALVTVSGSFSTTVAANNVLGWSGEGASRLRRAQGGGKITSCTAGVSESGALSPLSLQTWQSVSSVPNDDTFWLCRVTTAGVVFRDGTYLHKGDTLVNWRSGNEQVTCWAGDGADVGGTGTTATYLKKYREPNSGKVVGCVDYLGFANAGFVFDFQELFWRYDISTIVSTVVPTPSWSPWTAYIAGAGSTTQILFGAVDQPQHSTTLLGLQLKATSAGAGTVHLTANKSFSAAPFAASEDCLIVGEWTVGFPVNQLPSAGKKASFSFGFADLRSDWNFHPSSGLVGGLPSNKNYWVFFCDLNGVWYAASRRVSGFVDVQQLTFTPTASSVYRFRIELVGSAYQGAVHGGHARFWIDEAYVNGTGVAPSGLLGAQDSAPCVGPVFAAGCAEAGSGDASLTFGPMKIRWKQMPQTT